MSPAPSFLLRLLLVLYVPFLLLLCLVMGWLIALLVQGMMNLVCVPVLAIPLIGLLGLTVLQILSACRALLTPPPEQVGIELALPRGDYRELYGFVERLARELGLRAPHEIRLAPDAVAHVYEDARGLNVLVLGGVVVAAFSQEALAGVIAHELAHFTAGDTRLSRRAFRRALVMETMEEHFRARPGTAFNPLVWLVHLYHLLFRLAWAGHSRRQEFAADRRQVERAGKGAAAAALLHVTVTERLPWVRLSAIAKSHVAADEPIERIFAEQVRRARATEPSEWQEACRRELKRRGGRFDSHPPLRERLKAMGVPVRTATELVLPQSGPPARELFPDWEAIERELTEVLIAAVREEYLAKRELAQIILGRPPP